VIRDAAAEGVRIISNPFDEMAPFTLPIVLIRCD